jgi:cytochrome c oxidase cbb3-type subunit 1
MSTFEGPLMSIKSVNSLSHYTDWTIGHVHSGALGWVGFITFGALYYLVPRTVGPRTLYSHETGEPASVGRDDRDRSLHHRDVGFRHHAGSDVADYDDMGFLEYSFVETVMAMHPFYVIRALGGRCTSGALIMVYNFWRTIKGDVCEKESIRL